MKLDNFLLAVAKLIGAKNFLLFGWRDMYDIIIE